MSETPELFEVPKGAKRDTPRKSTAVAKKAAKEVARTEDGHSAADIIGQWVDICKKRTGVPVPHGTLGRVGKQVKQLITSGYSTNQIKVGLSVWTARWFNNPLIAPEQLESLTWKASMDATPEGRSFQQEVHDSVHAMLGHSSAVTGGGTARERRDTENARGAVGWRERLEETRRQKKELGL